MSFDPIEGVDYIFDRYAYLELETTASKDEIHKAIMRLRAAVHTDRLNNVHPDILAKAKGISGTIDACSKILEDQELRPLFTERLLDFRHNKPGLVSINGVPIINLSSERTDIEYLLRDGTSDFEEAKGKVQQMSGYSPKQVYAARKFYELDPNEENRQLLESTLTTKFVYYSVLENAAWARAGIHAFQARNKQWMLEPSEYEGRLETDIQDRHDQILDAVIERNNALRIGVGAPLLLLTDQSNQIIDSACSSHLSDVDVEAIAKIARKTFSERAMLIREIAKEKQQVLIELVDLTFIEDLGIPIDLDKAYGLHLMALDPEELKRPCVLISFQVDADGNINGFAGGTSGLVGLSKNDLVDLKTPGCIIYHNKELSDFLIQVAHAAKSYVERVRVEFPLRPPFEAPENGQEPIIS